jgi:hypothetical protein
MREFVFLPDALRIRFHTALCFKMMSEGREWSLSIAQENMLVPQERNIGDN